MHTWESSAAVLVYLVTSLFRTSVHFTGEEIWVKGGQGSRKSTRDHTFKCGSLHLGQLVVIIHTVYCPTPGAPIPKQGEWYPGVWGSNHVLTYASNQDSGVFQKIFILSELPNLFIQQTCTKQFTPGLVWGKAREGKKIRLPCHNKELLGQGKQRD